MIVDAPAAMREPATWGVMLGFGAVGGDLRARRRRIAFPVA